MATNVNTTIQVLITQEPNIPTDLKPFLDQGYVVTAAFRELLDYTFILTLYEY